MEQSKYVHIYPRPHIQFKNWILSISILVSNQCGDSPSKSK